MLFGDLNIYKHPCAFIYDTLGIDITPIMMWTKNWPECLVVISLLNTLVRDYKQLHSLSFKLYTSL